MKFSFDNVKFGLSERGDGAMKLIMPCPDLENVENRKKYFKTLGINYDNAVAAGLMDITLQNGT